MCFRMTASFHVCEALNLSASVLTPSLSPEGAPWRCLNGLVFHSPRAEGSCLAVLPISSTIKRHETLMHAMMPNLGNSRLSERSQTRKVTVDDSVYMKCSEQANPPDGCQGLEGEENAD